MWGISLFGFVGWAVCFYVPKCPLGWPVALAVYGTLLLGPAWALWRFDQASRGLTAQGLRRDLALAGVPASDLLRGQLRYDALTAFCPLVLPALHVLGYLAASLAARAFLGTWKFSSIAATHLLLLLHFLPLMQAAVVIAGAGWIFRGRCRGVTGAGIAVRTVLTLAAPYAVVLASYFVVRVVFWSVFWQNGGRFNPLPHLPAVAALLTAIVLAPAAAQLVPATPEAVRIRGWARTLLVYLLCWTSAAATLALVVRTMGAGTLSVPLQDWSQSWSSLAAVAACAALAGFGFIALARNAAPSTEGRLWPKFLAGAVTVAGGIWLAAVCVETPSPHFRKALPWVVATLPLTGMSWLAALRIRSGSCTAAAAGLLLLATAGGAVLGAQRLRVSLSFEGHEFEPFAKAALLLIMEIAFLCSILVSAARLYGMRLRLRPAFALQVKLFCTGMVCLFLTQLVSWISADTWRGEGEVVVGAGATVGALLLAHWVWRRAIQEFYADL